MNHHPPPLSKTPRMAGKVYTRPWMVELMLDLAGYLPELPLARLVALEPSVGDGAFLLAMVRRLVEYCRRHDFPLAQATEAIGAFELAPTAAEKAVAAVSATLVSLGTPCQTASTLARSWIRTGDFLEASLAFPVADFVLGNPPYIRLEEIPESKAASYRNSFSAMRGRADIYVAFYQAALLQLKPGGVCAYICADRWMLNDYGSALRSFITTEGYNVRCVIEAHDAFIVIDESITGGRPNHRILLPEFGPANFLRSLKAQILAHYPGAAVHPGSIASLI